MSEPETLSVVVEREIPFPPEKIWRALTQPHLIEEWLMKNDFKPVVGHRFNLRAEPNPRWNGIVDCEVLAVEPSTTLSYAWALLVSGASSPGPSPLRARGRTCGWSNQDSAPINSRTTRAPGTGGSGSFANLEQSLARMD